MCSTFRAAADDASRGDDGGRLAAADGDDKGTLLGLHPPAFSRAALGPPVLHGPVDRLTEK